jgi:mono/diheme cytochrome c family protein
MRTTSFLLSVAAGAYAGTLLAVTLSAGPAVQEGQTTLDGVYTEAQAVRGKEFFEKTCAKCHVFEPVTPKLEGPLLGGETFFNNWEGKSVFQIVTSIRLGMPPDGSVIVDATQAADVVAFILMTNKLPAGTSELVADATARNIKIARPGGEARRSGSQAR